MGLEFGTATYKKTLSELERQIKCWRNGTDFEYGIEPLEVAAVAIKKQIKEKVLKKWDKLVDCTDYYRYHCPNCENQIMNPNANYKYCPYCGQKLDWKGLSEE